MTEPMPASKKALAAMAATSSMSVWPRRCRWVAECELMVVVLIRRRLAACRRCAWLLVIVVAPVAPLTVIVHWCVLAESTTVPPLEGVP